MLFVVTGLDGPGRDALRVAHYEAHKARLTEPLPVRVVMSGPLVTDDDSRMIGSHFLVEAESRAAVEAFLEGDPFLVHGVWATTEVRAFRKRVG